METYIAIFLLIIPGFIVRQVYEKLNRESPSKSDFENTIISLILSIFVLLMNYIWIVIYYPHLNITLSLLNFMFSRVSFIFKYIIITILNGLYVALIWYLLRAWGLFACNVVRKNTGKNIILDYGSLLDSLNDGKQHMVMIEDGKKKEYGLFNKIENKRGNITGISIKRLKETRKLIDDFGEENYEVKEKIYLFQNNIVITEFDTDDLDEKRTSSKFLLFMLGSLGFFGVHFVLYLLFHALSDII